MTQNRRFRPLLAALLLLAVPVTGRSQESGVVLEGWVVTAGTREPTPGVLLRFESGPDVLTDEEGYFLVGGLEAGVQDVVLVTADCRLSTAEIEVRPGTLHRVELFLPASIAARLPAPDADPPVKPDALVLNGAEIAEMRVRNVTEIVRRVVPSMVGNAGGRVGGYARLQSRSINSLVDRNPPVVVVDGVRVANGAEVLDMLHPSDVERLEILRGAAAGWEYGSSGSAGAILVTTRRGADVGGFGDAGPLPDARRCPIPDVGAEPDR